MVRLISILGVLTMLLGGLGQLRPQWLAEMDLDLWKLRDYGRQFMAAQQRLAELEEQSAAVRERAKSKERIVRELAAGRTTLLEAAAALQRLEEERPLPTDVSCLSSGDTKEKYCRAVLLALEAHSFNYPETVPAGLAERLERELADRVTESDGLR